MNISLRAILGLTATSLLLLLCGHESPAAPGKVALSNAPMLTISSGQGRLTRTGAAFSLTLKEQVRMRASTGASMLGNSASVKGDATGFREARITNADTQFTIFQQEAGKEVEYLVRVTAGLLEITGQGMVMKFTAGDQGKNRPVVVMTPLDSDTDTRYDFTANEIVAYTDARTRAQQSNGKVAIDYFDARGDIDYNARYYEEGGVVRTTQQGTAQYLTLAYEKSLLLPQPPLLITLGSKGASNIQMTMTRHFLVREGGKWLDDPAMQDEVTTLQAQTVMLRRSARDEVMALAKTLGAASFEERNLITLSGKVHCVMTRATPLMEGQLLTIPVPLGPQEWEMNAELIRLAVRVSRYGDGAPSYDYWLHMDRGENAKGVKPYIGVKDLTKPTRPPRYLSGDPTLSFGVNALLGTPETATKENK